MALTQAQLNQHLRDMLQAQVALEGEDLHRAILIHYLKACIVHARLGGADNIEAGQTIAQFIAQQYLGHALSAGDLHILRKHWALEADETAGEVL